MFDEKTSMKKLWAMFRSVLMKIKAKNIGENLLFSLGIDKESLETTAGDLSFPQLDYAGAPRQEHTPPVTPQHRSQGTPLSPWKN